jgi:sodium/bile acid cotransporter 7
VFKAVARYLPDPFVLFLFATVGTASLFPAHGIAGDVLGVVATAAIIVLFFLHGAKLSRENVLLAVGHWRLHLTILSITFIVFPLVGLLLADLFPKRLDTDLWVGVLFLCALPSTVQSSIAFTSIARGNVGGTIASAAASNLLGIGLTPLIINWLTRSHAALSLSGVGDIVFQMLIPFVAGHLCRPLIGPWAEKRKALLAITDRGTIILAVYSAFSAAVLGKIWQTVRVETLGMLVVICAALLGILLAVSLLLSRMFKFPRADEISIVFCGSKKSLVSGVPMARVLFAGPHVGAVLLPLMIFHQLQLIVCAGIARRYAGDSTASPVPTVERS